VAVTKDQLQSARMQRILQVEGRQDELEVVLRGQTGLAENTLIDVTPEDLPGVAEQEGANLVALALQDNVALRVAESDVRAKEFRLTGEKRGYYPTSSWSVCTACWRNSTTTTNSSRPSSATISNAGIQMQVPIFSAQIRANIALAQVNLDVAKAALSNKKTEVSAAVRVKTRRLRERDAAKKWRVWSCNSRNKT